MPAKVCPRCGAQYATLKSATCPQCFAKLLTVDDTTAEELTAARLAVEQSPEYLEAKTEDDAKFGLQSFNACLSVLGITLLTAIVAIVIIVAGIHRHHSSKRAAAVTDSPLADPMAQSPMPSAGASVDQALPPRLADSSGISYQRTQYEQTINLSGRNVPIFHAVYANDSANGTATDVYAIPANQITGNTQGVQIGISLAAQPGSGLSRTSRVFQTQNWVYVEFEPGNSSSQGAPDKWAAALANFLHVKAPL